MNVDRELHHSTVERSQVKLIYMYIFIFIYRKPKDGGKEWSKKILTMHITAH